MIDLFTTFYVGQKATNKRTYTQEDVKEFAKLSGDNNPIHLDVDFAKRTIFKNPIVHGVFVTSQISNLIANNLPGAGSIYINQEVQFVAPVYWETEVICEVEIVEIKEAKRILILKAKCFDRENNILINSVSVIKYL